jgi:hypothetical protein
MTKRPIHEIVVRLRDQSHKLPMPGVARLFGSIDGQELVDNRDQFWLACLADGTLEIVHEEDESPRVECEFE